MSKIKIILLMVFFTGLIYLFTRKYLYEYMEKLYILLDDVEWTETDATTHIIITRFNEDNIDKLIKPMINKSGSRGK